MHILRGFLKNKELGLGSRQALRLEEQIVSDGGERGERNGTRSARTL
jgi:hypothetical protein